LEWKSKATATRTLHSIWGLRIGESGIRIDGGKLNGNMDSTNPKSEFSYPNLPSPWMFESSCL